MSATPRRLLIAAAVVLSALLVIPALHAAAPVPAPSAGAESVLLNAANRDRAAYGLAPLQWDPSLAGAALQHAALMAERNLLSHQLPGEGPVQVRATQFGARFSVIAENIASGPDPSGIHVHWMNSAPHRANLLAADLNAIGIAVVQSGNMLYAVEDFSAAVPSASLESQEALVASQLAERGLRAGSSVDARKTCDTDRGWAGPRPVTVMRYETADLRHLPAELDRGAQSGKYHAAAIGACEVSSPNAGGFTRFRIAVLLY